jgi:thioredoxin 1
MIEVNKANFSTEVLESAKPVIVDFWGQSCQPCLKLLPDVEKLEESYRDKVKIVKLNSTENRRVCIDHNVMGLPSFLVFKNGQEVKRVSGSEVSREDIENLIKEQL